MPTQNSYTPFADWLSDTRSRLRLSQQELAAAAGISQSMISNMERGARAPSRATILTLAAAIAADPVPGLLAAGFLPEQDSVAETTDPEYRRLLEAGWSYLSYKDKDEIIQLVTFKRRRSQRPPQAAARVRMPLQAVDSERAYLLAAYDGKIAPGAAPAVADDPFAGKRAKSAAAKRRRETAADADALDTDSGDII